MPNSGFGINPGAGPNHEQVAARAHQAMAAIASDANVQAIAQVSWGTYEVTRYDGSTFLVRVVSAEVTDGKLAEVEVTGPGRVEIRVSPRTGLGIVERTVADAVGLASAVLDGAQTRTDVLTATSNPAPGAQLSANDHGRQAEVRHLDRAKRETSRLRVLRRRQIAAEMHALVNHLGLHPDDPGVLGRRAATDIAHIVTQHVLPGSPRTTPPAAPPAPTPAATPGTPGPRTRADSVRALDHSRFAANPDAQANWAAVQEQARTAMSRIAEDAGVASVTRDLGRPFVVTRHDGSTFTVTVFSNHTGNRNPAELVVDSAANHVIINVSPRAGLGIVERAMANALAQASALLAGAQTATDVLDGTTHPGDTTELSPADQGRQAEIRNLDRAKRETSRLRVLRRRQLAAEMRTLVEHLGLHPDDDVAAARLAVSDVAHTVGAHVHTGDKRPAWALPPNGYPKWKAFLRYHLPAEVLPGVAAGSTIVAVGAPPVIGAAVGVGAIASGLSGTLIKHWYGRLNKTNTDTGHGDAIKVRGHEAALRRKKLLDPLLDRMGTARPAKPGPVEPAPQLDKPAKYQPYVKRLIARGGPAAVGAGAASLLMFTGLPFWNAASHWGVALFSAALGPIAERYFRNSLVEREWAQLDNVGRQQDARAAEFDERFAEQLSALLDRIEHLGGTTPATTAPNADPVAEHDVNNTGLDKYGAEQAAGNSTNLARAGADAVPKFQQAAIDAAFDLLFTGGLRVAVGTLANTFLDRNFTVNEYKEIVAQVHHDFRNKMVEQVAVEQKILETILADLTAKVDQAEATINRVNATLASRLADLRAATPPVPAPDDPADRPRGHQRMKAFAKLHLKQAAVMETAMVSAAVAFDQGTAPMIIIGAVATAVVATFPLRYLFRRSEQIAVDETIFADRRKERPVETAEAAARSQFMIEFWTREIDAIVSGQTTQPAMPSQPVPQYPNRAKPEYPGQIEQHVQYEREAMFREPRPWSLTGPKLLALDRLERMVARVRAFDAHAQTTGNARPAMQAREELRKLWEAYNTLKQDGTPMPPDYELLKPDGMRGGHPGVRPATDLQSYMDTSEDTPAGRAYYAPGELDQTVFAVPPEPGQYTIDMHGGPDFVRIGGDRLTPADLATLIRADDKWHGEAIRLLACETGQSANGFAQQLADLLGVTVYAPTDAVGVDADGRIHVTSFTVNENGDVVPGLPGSMYTFEPTVTEDTPPMPGPAHALWWPDSGDIEFGEQRELKPGKELGELTLMRDGPTVYTGADRLWPDELADVVAEAGDWDGGPTRLQVRGGHVDPEFVQRLADLLGTPVIIPEKSVAGEFPALSSGTLEVYNERSADAPPGCVVYQPRTVMAGETP